MDSRLHRIHRGGGHGANAFGPYEPPYEPPARARGPQAPHYCESCGQPLAAADTVCTTCGTPVAPAPDPAAGRPARDGAAASVPPPLAGARIWCPDESAVQSGRPVAVRFAFAPEGAPGAGEPPLAEPVPLRILLESEAAAVHPVTRVTELRPDRTTEAVEFAVTPERTGLAPLHFSVYRDRDGQLLQRVSAELPVDARGFPDVEVEVL
ncbi:hypothetical protein [Actinacidiphila epipremni]|uniref:Zinc ribbon domain-containing protein n=1 Tax=Actinacidiphila epipremni TaxID=2053013 RepID=A0ABX0ZTJ3_9ACTN|nr:hypothetical protein [Actinacidiphila epipremni]NJP45911.1 hypothetical protein [Actinacidiphila epipremni]